MHWSSSWRVQAVTRYLRSWKPTMSGHWWKKRIHVHMPCCILLGMHSHTVVNLRNMYIAMGVALSLIVGESILCVTPGDKTASCTSVCFMYVHVHSVNVYAVVVFFHRLLSDSYPDEVKKIVDCLSANLTGVYDAHRITVVSFYSEVRQTVLWCEEFVLVYTSVFVLLDACYI